MQNVVQAGFMCFPVALHENGGLVGSKYLNLKGSLPSVITQTKVKLPFHLLKVTSNYVTKMFRFFVK